MTLEEVFNGSDWTRKFRTWPHGLILRLWRDSGSAEKAIVELSEETETHCRGLYLASDSIGEFLAITQEEWEEF